MPHSFSTAGNSPTRRSIACPAVCLNSCPEQIVSRLDYGELIGTRRGKSCCCCELHCSQHRSICFDRDANKLRHRRLLLRIHILEGHSLLQCLADFVASSETNHFVPLRDQGITHIGNTTILILRHMPGFVTQQMEASVPSVLKMSRPTPDAGRCRCR